MQDVTWLVFVKTFWTRITSVFFLGRHYQRICHQLNIYGMNSLYVFTTVKIHRKHYLSCVTHLCLSETISHKPLSTIRSIASEKLSLLQEVVTHIIEIRRLPYCMIIYVCPWYVLIMMLRNFVDVALFVMPIWIKLCKKYYVTLYGGIVKENITNIYIHLDCAKPKWGSKIFVLINVNSKPMELYISVVFINNQFELISYQTFP